MSYVELDDDETLLKRMQHYRVDLIESIMTPVPDAQGNVTDLREQDPKLLRVALSAMDGVDNSIIKQRRLELDKKSMEGNEAFQETMVEVMKTVLDKGGLALKSSTTADTPTEAPTVNLSALPEQQITAEESLVGVEHIEYDDIMAKK